MDSINPFHFSSRRVPNGGMPRPSFLPDPFTLALVATVAAASVLPAHGAGAIVFERLTTCAIGALFFLHGAKLSREAILAGLTHWRLHLLIFACTFALFPLVGLALRPVLSPLVTPALYAGILFLCVMPATVQSSIAFTAMARGNVPAAVCSASASTLLGVFVSPLLVSVVVAPHAGIEVSWGTIGRIVLQLVVPFVAGHLVRPWIAGWTARNRALLSHVDRSSVLLVVYTAFSAAVTEGLWSQVPLTAVLGLLAICAVLLAIILASTTWIARRLGFDKEDEIAIVFCSSKKSLASGVPMANVLFASGAVGAMVLPLMLFHQLQLMVCAVLAQRYARRGDREDATPASRVVGGS